MLEKNLNPSPSSSDVFPSTCRSWIDRKFLEGERGRAELNDHIMTVYAWPLEVYILGSSFRQMGDAGDLVRSFFADRLGRRDFLQKWKRSGKRLRYWLVNGLKFHLRELYRKKTREKRGRGIPPDLPEGSGIHSPERDMDRAFKITLVRRALLDVREVCQREGLETHWEIFFRHWYLEEPYATICERVGVTPNLASKMGQVVLQRVRGAIRSLLARDGATPGEIEREIKTLLETAE